MHNQHSIGLNLIAYRFPSQRLTVEDCEKKDLLNSPPTVLRDFGFTQCFVEENQDDFVKNVIESSKQSLPNKNEDVASLIFYTGINRHEKQEHHLAEFNYVAPQIHHGIGLKNAEAITHCEQGCGGVLSTINMAFHFLNSSGKQSVIVVAGDRLQGKKREIIYNLMSDASCSFLVQRNSPTNKILGYHQVTHTYYWDTQNKEQELLAAYFPMAQRVITEALSVAGLQLADIDWIVPHNVSIRSWDILSKLLKIPNEKVWLDNVKKYGHTVSCDHFVNLKDMEEQKIIRKGDKLLLFTFGFGANWTALLLEH